MGITIHRGSVPLAVQVEWQRCYFVQLDFLRIDEKIDLPLTCRMANQHSDEDYRKFVEFSDRVAVRKMKGKTWNLSSGACFYAMLEIRRQEGGVIMKGETEDAREAASFCVSCGGLTRVCSYNDCGDVMRDAQNDNICYQRQGAYV